MLAAAAAAENDASTLTESGWSVEVHQDGTLTANYAGNELFIVYGRFGGAFSVTLTKSDGATPIITRRPGQGLREAALEVAGVIAAGSHAREGL